MAETGKRAAKKAPATKAPDKKAPAKKSTRTSTSGFSAEERAAMKEYAAEKKRARSGKTDPTQDVLDKIAEMPDDDRVLAEKLHALITGSAPDLTPRTWYGMPAYAKDGDVLCFFQNASKFKARYATLGFSDKAALDKGAIWPTSYALTEWTATVEKEIRALLTKAVG